MNICSHSHPEICFDGRNCPACALQDQVDHWKDLAVKYKSEANDAESKVEELQAELAILSEPLTKAIKEATS